MKIRLANGSMIQYESDNGLNFTCPRSSLEECGADQAKLIPDNLKNVTLITNDGRILANFVNLVLIGTEELPIYNDSQEVIEGYNLIIHLREKTNIELLTERLDILEDSQNTQDDAIEDLGEAVSVLFEEE